MNADVWKDEQGRIGTELRRTFEDGEEKVLLVSQDEGYAFPAIRWAPLSSLTPEVSRYEGARNGRVKH